MTKILFPTPLQSKVIYNPEDKRVTLFETTRGCGKTITLLFKALKEQNRNCTIVQPTYREAQQTAYSSYNFLRQCNFKLSKSSLIIDNGFMKIKFIGSEDPDKLLGLDKDLIMFDNVQNCNSDSFKQMILRKPKQLVVTCDPFNYGYIKYKPHPEDTENTVNKRYIVDYKRSSWAVMLLDEKYVGWETDNLSKPITPFMFSDFVYYVRREFE